jgi:hypothetical protein
LKNCASRRDPALSAQLTCAFSSGQLPRAPKFIQTALVHPQDPAPAEGPDAFKLYQLIEDLAADAQVAGGFRNGHERFQTFLRSIQIGHEHFSLRFFNLYGLYSSKLASIKAIKYLKRDTSPLAAKLFISFLITLSGHASGVEIAPENLETHDPRG